MVDLLSTTEPAIVAEPEEEVVAGAHQPAPAPPAPGQWATYTQPLDLDALATNTGNVRRTQAYTINFTVTTATTTYTLPSYTGGFTYNPGAGELTREQHEALRRCAAAVVERAARQREEWRAQRQRALAAKERAKALLHSLLTPAQRSSLKRHQHFYVTGSEGRRYRIRAQGQAGNVDWMDGRRVGASLCIHPAGVCDEDAWIAQMLAIMHHEEHFLATANLTGGAWPPGHQHGRRDPQFVMAA